MNHFSIHTPNLLKEIARNTSDFQAIAMPLQILGAALADLADYASRTDNTILHAHMMRLTLFSQSDPESKDYNKKAVDYYRGILESQLSMI